MSRICPPVSPPTQLGTPTAEKPTVLVQVCTFNEAGNLPPLVTLLLEQDTAIQVLVVDDASPDGTGEVADRLARQHPRLHVLHRPRREGLAAALCSGYRWAADHSFDLIANLDGDFSHDPRELAQLVAATQEFDVVLGSRYAHGVRVLDWPARRIFLSLAAAAYVRLFTRMPYRDPTSGYRCFRRQALEAVLAQPRRSHGFCYHIETLFQAHRAGFAIGEVPIVFRERKVGQTKLNSRIVGEALWVAATLPLRRTTKPPRRTQWLRL